MAKTNLSHFVNLSSKGLCISSLVTRFVNDTTTLILDISNNHPKVNSNYDGDFASLNDGPPIVSNIIEWSSQIEYLTDILRYNYTLTNVNASNCVERGKQVSKDDIKELRSVLEKNYSLTTLNVSGNKLESDPDFFQFLSYILERNSKIAPEVELAKVIYNSIINAKKAELEIAPGVELSKVILNSYMNTKKAEPELSEIKMTISEFKVFYDTCSSAYGVVKKNAPSQFTFGSFLVMCPEYKKELSLNDNQSEAEVYKKFIPLHPEFAHTLADPEKNDPAEVTFTAFSNYCKSKQKMKVISWKSNELYLELYQILTNKDQATEIINQIFNNYYNKKSKAEDRAKALQDFQELTNGAYPLCSEIFNKQKEKDDKKLSFFKFFKFYPNGDNPDFFLPQYGKAVEDSLTTGDNNEFDE